MAATSSDAALNHGEAILRVCPSMVSTGTWCRTSWAASKRANDVSSEVTSGNRRTGMSGVRGEAGYALTRHSRHDWRIAVRDEDPADEVS